MKKKVFIRAGGGLGNQLFKYAAARAVSLTLDRELILEVGGFSRDSFGRQYLLDCFKGPGAAKKTRFKDNIFGRSALFAAKKISFIPGIRFCKIIHERDFPESSPGADAVGKCFWLELEGYWQSEIYFKNIRKKLLEELVFKPELNQSSRLWADRIQSVTNPVALHIRSYNEVKGSMHGKRMDADYYLTSALVIQKRFPDATFFLFTDDIDMAKVLLPGNFSIEFVDANLGGGETGGLGDLYLMSLCKHFITANSSFSWWGAWLSQCVHGEFDVTSSSRIAIYPDRNLTHHKMVPDFGRKMP